MDSPALREALHRLASEGLVEFPPRRGAFVVNPTLDQMQDMIVLRAMLGGMAGGGSSDPLRKKSSDRFQFRF